jgi:hypothetical protein
LSHAIAKSNQLGLNLLINRARDIDLEEIAKTLVSEETLGKTDVALLLKPSKGMLEASDTLTEKHDWIQEEDEIVEEIERIIYRPMTSLQSNN